MSAQEAFELGAKIQRARRKTGLELVSIAGEICVSKSYLTAIEEGRFEALPAFPFAMGFVRSFAQQIGLNANEIASEFKEIVKPVVVEEEGDLDLPSNPVIEAKKTAKRGPIYGGIAVVLSALSAAWMIFIGGGQQAAYVKTTPAKEITQLAAAKVDDSHLVQDTQGVPAKHDTTAIVADTAVAEKNDTALVDIPADTVSKTVSDTIVAVEEEFAPANNQLMGVANADDEGSKDLNLLATEVMFEARQDSWVRITSDDAILFEGVLRSGDHYVPPMGPSLNLTTNNAGGLALHIGEHDLGVLGVKGGIIENAKIDPDSLILRLVETL